MKATKFIKDAIYQELGYSFAYTIKFQGRIWGIPDSLSFDAAIILVNQTNIYYKIRAWHDGACKVELCHGNLISEFKELLLLD